MPLKKATKWDRLMRAVNGTVLISRFLESFINAFIESIYATDQAAAFRRTIPNALAPSAPGSWRHSRYGTSSAAEPAMHTPTVRIAGKGYASTLPTLSASGRA